MSIKTRALVFLLAYAKATLAKIRRKVNLVDLIKS